MSEGEKYGEQGGMVLAGGVKMLVDMATCTQGRDGYMREIG